LQNRLIEMVWELQGFVPQDNGHYKYFYSFDTIGNLIERLYIHKNWSDEWSNGEKILYTYDDRNNLIEEFRDFWYDEGWGHNYRYAYIYDVNNNLIEELYQQSDDYLFVLANVRKTTCSYNISNKLTLVIIYIWENEQWKKRYEDLYTYDSNNNLIEYLGKYWDWFFDFRYEYKTTYMFDLQNNMKCKSYQEWWSSWGSDEWRNIWKYTYTFDKNNNTIEGYFEKWENDKWVNSNSTYWYNGIQYYSPLTLYYNNKESNYLYYGCHKIQISYLNLATLSVPETPPSTDNLHLYPNPISNILYINLENTPTPPEVKIYSLQGVLVLQTNGNQIDVSSLPAGFYVANVNGINRKIIKQ